MFSLSEEMLRALQDKDFVVLFVEGNRPSPGSFMHDRGMDADTAGLIDMFNGLGYEALDTYFKNTSNANGLMKNVSDLPIESTSQLLNEVGLTPNLSKQLKSILKAAPKKSENEGIFPEEENRRSSFGEKESDKTSSLDALSRSSGQSTSDQLQKALANIKNSENSQKLEEKKVQLGENLKKLSDKTSPFERKDYEEVKKIFMDEDNRKMLDKMTDLNPNFIKNAQELYYGKDGERSFGLSDNDLKKRPLLNFLEQFSERNSNSPSVPRRRDSGEGLRHQSSVEEETH